MYFLQHVIINLMFYEVIPTRIFREGSNTLTYSSAEKLLPGQIVKIPLGRSETTGIILKEVTPVDFPTKPIISKLYETPLPPHILKSIIWLSQYYLVPLPKAANLFLPNGLNKKRRKSQTGPSNSKSYPQTFE